MEAPPPPLSQADSPVSTTALIGMLYQELKDSQEPSLGIDSESLVVLGGHVPAYFLERVWQHAHLRTEDEMILLTCTSESSRSVLLTTLSCFPNVRSEATSAVSVLYPFLCAMTPENLNHRFHNGICVSLSLNEQGSIVSTRISLGEQPLSSVKPLTSLKSEEGYRAFEVFYHMLYSQEDRSDILGLKIPALYDCLNSSGTYILPDYVLDADDRALAKDWLDLVNQCLPREFRRSLITTLSGILLLGNKQKNDQVEGAALIGLDPKLSSQYPSHELVAATYVALVNAVVTHLNNYLALCDSAGTDENEILSVVHIVECASQHKCEILRSVFDNTYGINSEMTANGIQLPKAPQSISSNIKKMILHPYIPDQLSVIQDFSGIVDSSVTWPRVALKQEEQDYTPFDLDRLVPSSRLWTVLPLACHTEARGVIEGNWSSTAISSQIRAWYLSEWAVKRGPADFTADFGIGDFITWLRSVLPEGPSGFQLGNWAASRGYGPTDFFYGIHRIYISEMVWQELEQMRQAAEGVYGNASYRYSQPNFTPHSDAFSQSAQVPRLTSGASVYSRQGAPSGLFRPQSMAPSLAPTVPAHQVPGSFSEHPGEPLQVPPHLRTYYDSDGRIQQVQTDFSEDHYVPEEGSDYDETEFLRDYRDIEKSDQHIEVHNTSMKRKLWLILVWTLTWWIPSPLMRWPFGMKRRDMRMAWREKLVIFFLIFLLNGAIIFYLIFLGRLICSDYDKVWNHKDLSYHQGKDDFFVGLHGKVYDFTRVFNQQIMVLGLKVTPDLLLQVAGEDISDYFQPPLSVYCPTLVSDDSLELLYNQTESPYTFMSSLPGTTFSANDAEARRKWYSETFMPAMKSYRKGDIVETRKGVTNIAHTKGKYVFFVDKKIFDVTNYMITRKTYPETGYEGYKKYKFFPTEVESIFESYKGLDATDKFSSLDPATRRRCMDCLENTFYYAKLDFRSSARCQASNVILLVIAGILTSVTLIKFLASMRVGTKPLPSPQDRFVICQVPAYTESEDDLRLSIDSLTTLDYDNQRKLLMIICDGIVVGAGNDRTTPQIVLDILGVDDRMDPELKAYHAISEGSKELNYAKVYAGLYECEGNIVPYIVIVKCGTPNENNKPGNRGKRDSQLIVLNFLNRVHSQGLMSPLELELFHMMNNVIGVEPERYDYLFTIDADTKVEPDSLTRLVAACTNDNKIAAVCGETSIENEQQSLTTMIQVYEYFISHHLTKAFESLFGSVTCLPGCFSLFRLRTAQRFKPIIISDEVIRDYSVRHVDNLHKKNLFSLGEDRYLTTLVAKHFPRLKLKFVADARCKTHVPDDVAVLISQRRRWINSTVHNLVELLRLKTMCGFFLCSMRGVVFIDLIGTLMLPSVVVYLGYLIYVIASKSSPLPIISIVLIGIVYGLQTIVYILHRRWQHIFWMLIYIAAYPFHSFILPIYSFWKMDDFSWGTTRVVIDESKGKKVVLQSDTDKFDPSSVYYETWHSYATRVGIPGVERTIIFDDRRGRVVQNVFEMPNDPFKEESHDYPASLYSKPATAVPELPAPVFDDETEERIRSCIKGVLREVDLNVMTTGQLRNKVGDLLGVDFHEDRAIAVDGLIDEELDLLEDEEDEEGFMVPHEPEVDDGPFGPEKPAARDS